MPISSPDDVAARYAGFEFAAGRSCDTLLCDGLVDGVFAAVDDPFFNDTYEPILMPSHCRFTLFPLHSIDLWSLYKAAASTFWVPEAVDVSADLVIWNGSLNVFERHFISHVLALFASSKGVVYEHIARRFAAQVQLAEVRCFYGLQMAIENVHLEACSRLVETYVVDAMQRQFLYNALENLPFVRRKADWMMRWVDDEDIPFRIRLVAFAAAEGIFFSGAFAGLAWIEQQCLLPGLAVTARLISRDEELHTAFACMLMCRLRLRPCIHIVHKIVADAVSIEKAFVMEALPVSRLGMDPAEMEQYIDCVADRLLEGMGYEKMTQASNPFPFLRLKPLNDHPHALKASTFTGVVLDEELPEAIDPAILMTRPPPSSPVDYLYDELVGEGSA